jgi:hypothetical protein
MRRRYTKGSRANGAAPTPIASARTTPLSSAYPSTCASENENDDYDVVTQFSSMTLNSDARNEVIKKTKAKPFPFLSLPSELRLKIYVYHFSGCNGTGTIDLDPDNYKRIHKKLAILRTCRIVYAEASHLFYSVNAFRIFPTFPGRFFKTKRPLLARLASNQRRALTTLELRLGPGWTSPPRGWVVNPALGLKECVNVRKLTVYVECDPSDNFFTGFRTADGFYEGFCRTLLDNVLNQLPMLKSVEFDAWPGVKKSGDMMRGLLEVVSIQNRMVTWGPERKWTDSMDDDLPTAKAKTTTTLVTQTVAVVA